MIKEIKHDLLKFSLIMRHQAHTAAGEKFEDFLEIEHVRSDDDGLAVRCRFKDIVAADLDEVAASGRKAIIFSQWVATLENLAGRLKHLRPGLYHGGVPSKHRDGVLEVAGYQLSAALARGLQGLQLSAADLAGRLGDVHCIEIGRRDPLHVSAALEQVVAQLTASGVRATAEALLGDAFWGATEIVTNDVVVATTAQHFAARLIS